jgi:hypothetical protein
VQYQPVKKRGLLFLVLLGMNGCATFVEREPEEVVRQRINERWSALIDGRLETAYTYETPEYRELYTFAKFRKKINGVGVWRKVEIERLSCELKKCVATVLIHVTIKFGVGFDSVESSGRSEEHWVQSSETGQWFHVSNQ